LNIRVNIVEKKQIKAEPGYIESLLRRILVRRPTELISVRAILRDVNGPKGGANDLQCLLIAQKLYGGEIIIRERGRQLRAVLSSAARKLRRQLGHK